jgi:hypothetical protein
MVIEAFFPPRLRARFRMLLAPLGIPPGGAFLCQGRELRPASSQLARPEHDLSIVGVTGSSGGTEPGMLKGSAGLGSGT